MIDDEWTYDAVRVGRATRTVEVAAPDGTHTIETGTVHFDPINEEDAWLYEEDSWVEHCVAPDADDALDRMVHVPMEKLGIVEFPEPLPDDEITEWLRAHPETWRPLLDDRIESDVTAADVMEEIR